MPTKKPFLHSRTMYDPPEQNRQNLPNKEPKDMRIKANLPKHTRQSSNVYFQVWPARTPIYPDGDREENQNFHSKVPVPG